MKCQYHECYFDSRGIPVTHESLITPHPIDLCAHHSAELIGYLNARDALALEEFSKNGRLGQMVIKDNLVTLFRKAFL